MSWCFMIKDELQGTYVIEHCLWLTICSLHYVRFCTYHVYAKLEF